MAAADFNDCGLGARSGGPGFRANREPVNIDDSLFSGEVDRV